MTIQKLIASLNTSLSQVLISDVKCHKRVNRNKSSSKKSSEIRKISLNLQTRHNNSLTRIQKCAYRKKIMYFVLHCLYTLHVSEDTCPMNEK